MLLSAVNDDHLMDKAHTDGSKAEVAMDNEIRKPWTGSVSAIFKDSSSEAGQTSTSDNNPSTLIINTQRCMSLYFARCTKVVQTLTDGAIPFPNLIATIRKLYDTKLRDTEILIPILHFLPKR
uniref:Uncharacterized protein n=1 Tax=Tanacetum cinerariifolium TaxID=118510 RepID=A0A699J255_TANCI|nr:hypothetical protein [Tanacetum cinerariifolium]